MSELDEMSEDAIRCGLRTRVLGQRIYAYAEVESTNDVAAELAFRGAEEGTLVVAEVQTKGRGRAGRSWHSPKSVGIWASLILRPTIYPANTDCITLLMGVSIAQAIRRRTGLAAVIKWPNDVLIDGKKVCGVLSEARSGEHGLNYVLSGFGVNVLQTREQFPEVLNGKATSLYLASGRKYSRIALLQEILEQVEQRYQAVGTSSIIPSIIQEWSALSVTSGQGPHFGNAHSAICTPQPAKG